jgi:hypothetical protein
MTNFVRRAPVPPPVESPPAPAVWFTDTDAIDPLDDAPFRGHLPPPTAVGSGELQHYVGDARSAKEK